MPRVTRFEIGADETDRVAQFYQAVFGWDMQKFGGPQEYWFVKTGDGQPGIDGGIFKRQGPMTMVNSIEVSAVDEFTAQIEAHGGKVVVPKMTMPGMGYLAYFTDTEGNLWA